MKKDDSLKLSIIVPIYNVEDYLERCIVSLLKQNVPYEKYEIILVNDGSIDNSYVIARHFSNRYTNIILLNQENRGQGAARNYGLEKARGDYVMFVDSDDQLLHESLNAVLDIAIESQAEVCAYGLVYYDDRGYIHSGAIQPFVTHKIYTGKYAIMHGADIGSSCTYLYLREFLNKHQLKFLEGVYHEDVDFIMRIYALAERIIFTDKTIYSYTYNTNSTDRKVDREKRKKQYCDEFTIVKHMRDFSTQNHLDVTLKHFYEKHGNSLIVSNILRLRKDKELPELSKYAILNFMKHLKLYPITGRTLSWKTSLLVPILNVECVLKRFVIY